MLVDPAAEAILLVDHRNAGRWLATGGHVDPGEHPFAAARREIVEELGVEATPLHGLGGHPLLVTQSTTFGVDAGHVDVGLWYVFERDRSLTRTLPSARPRWCDSLRYTVGNRTNVTLIRVR